MKLGSLYLHKCSLDLSVCWSSLRESPTTWKCKLKVKTFIIKKFQNNHMICFRLSIWYFREVFYIHMKTNLLSSNKQFIFINCWFYLWNVEKNQQNYTDKREFVPIASISSMNMMQGWWSRAYPNISLIRRALSPMYLSTIALDTTWR